MGSKQVSIQRQRTLLARRVAARQGSQTAKNARLVSVFTHDTYPFGLNMEGNWQGGLNGQNKYQYNGKELNQDFGLDWNDYGARFYDAALPAPLLA